LKKPTGSVRFRFYKPETKKTEPNRNRKKTEPNRKNRAQTEPNRKNRAKPIFVLKNQTEPKPVGLNRFRFFLKKNNFSLVFFFIKTKLNRKWTPLIISSHSKLIKLSFFYDNYILKKKKHAICMIMSQCFVLNENKINGRHIKVIHSLI
jgi:hypothetical protein